MILAVNVDDEIIAFDALNGTEKWRNSSFKFRKLSELIFILFMLPLKIISSNKVYYLSRIQTHLHFQPIVLLLHFYYPAYD